MQYISDKDIDRIAGNTGEALSREQRVNIVITPLADGSDTPWEGGLNGHFFRIRRGVEVEVPGSVAELIRQNEQVTILSRASVREYRRGRGKCLSRAREEA